MKKVKQPDDIATALKKEIMLQINYALWDMGAISKEMYEQASIKIVKIK